MACVWRCPKDGVIPTPRGSPEMMLLAGLTNRFSRELKEIDVAAILGGPVLRQFALDMNLDEGRVTFTPAEEADVMDAQLWRSRSSPAWKPQRKAGCWRRSATATARGR